MILMAFKNIICQGVTAGCSMGMNPDSMENKTAVSLNTSQDSLNDSGKDLLSESNNNANSANDFMIEAAKLLDPAYGAKLLKKAAANGNYEEGKRPLNIPESLKDNKELGKRLNLLEGKTFDQVAADPEIKKYINLIKPEIEQIILPAKVSNIMLEIIGAGFTRDPGTLDKVLTKHGLRALYKSICDKNQDLQTTGYKMSPIFPSQQTIGLKSA